MSSDYTVYAKTKKRSLRAVRSAAKTVLARHEGLRLAAADERDEDSLSVAGLGPIEVCSHEFGIALAISTTTGVPKERFVELGELAEEIAEALGTVITEAEALSLIAEEEGEKPRGSTVQADTAGSTGERVEIVLRSFGGEELHRSATTVAALQAQLLDSGRLSSTRLAPKVPAVLTDEGRRPFRASWLEITQYASDGSVVARYDYELNSQGRIVSVS